MTSLPSADTLASAQSQASVFRLLTWKATIPIEIQLARDSLPGGLPETDIQHEREGNGLLDGDEEVDLPRYYMQVPRYTYLPLLLPEIDDIFVSSIVNSSERELASNQTNEVGVDRAREDWWFEVEWSSRKGKQRDVCKWHWSLDMIQLHTIINSRPTSSLHQPDQRNPTSPSRSSPLRLILHLKPRQNPSTTNTVPIPPSLSNSIESCRIAFISLLKEADYIRWGNTRRITGLRRTDLEGAWEGITEHNYQTHARFTQKIVPLPLPVPASSTAKGTPGSSQPPENHLGVSAPESCYAVRSIPLKLYLGDNAPEVQDIVNPLNPQGEPTTVIQMLRQTLPLLFPDNQIPGKTYALATPILYGVTVPPEAEIAWLAACLCAPDGWLRIGIQLA